MNLEVRGKNKTVRHTSHRDLEILALGKTCLHWKRNTGRDKETERQKEKAGVEIGRECERRRGHGLVQLQLAQSVTFVMKDGKRLGRQRCPGANMLALSPDCQLALFTHSLHHLWNLTSSSFGMHN